MFEEDRGEKNAKKKEKNTTSLTSFMSMVFCASARTETFLLKVVVVFLDRCECKDTAFTFVGFCTLAAVVANIFL